MKLILTGIILLTTAAQGATITGTIRHSFDDSVGIVSIQSTITLTDGVQTITFSNNSVTLPGLGLGGCTLGKGVTGTCTYDPSFSTAITPSYIFTYLTPGGGGGANGTINFNGVGTPVTLQQTSGFSSHSNLPVTLSGTLDIRSFASGNPCVWCNQTFTGTGTSSGSFRYYDGAFNYVSYVRQVDFTLTTSEVPEPAAWMSFGVAALGLAALRKKIARR